jgi:hypothetical protein
MNANLKRQIEKKLNENKTIKYELTYETKGCNVELKIGDKKNEECGSIYDELSEWLGYDKFIDFLIDHGVQHNFSGEIYLENGEMCFLITLNGYCYEYDASDRRYIEFEEDFITNELKIDLTRLGMDDSFDNEKFSLKLYKRKNVPIERLDLFYYHDDWHQIKLNSIQHAKLTEFIESEIEKAIPDFNVDFECEILWEVECDENYLDFNYSSSPIKITLNEIGSK